METNDLTSLWQNLGQCDTIMLLTTAVFLFNLLCGIVPCYNRQKPPEILQEPEDLPSFLKNEELRRTPPIVRTPNGVLEGYLMKAMNGRLFQAFEGVPYGDAERWKLATPAEPWRGVRQAKKPGPDCLQWSPEKLFMVVGSEKCLYLNIYTPKVPSSSSRDFKRYPVVVFLHGGAFLLSSGASYGPTYLLSEDVIVVTLNYRLGVLGFLSLGNHEVPGNLGLKDQALALKHIYETIEYFGGNKHNISLWGQSAGAVSAHLHMISDKSRSYFSTAYASSGSAFHHWSVQSRERMMDLASRLARKVGCERKSSKELFRCFQKVDVNLLVASQVSGYDWYPFPPVTFSPVVEPEHPDAFLTVTPTEAYLAGNVSKKPIIFGLTKDEGKNIMIMLIPLLRMFPLRQMWSQIAPVFLQLNGVVKAPNEIVDKLDKFYFQGQNVWQVSFDVFCDMVSDRYLNMGIAKGIQAHISLGSPTFAYFFSYSEGNHNLANFIGYQSKDWGAGHFEDTTYLFNLTILAEGHKQSDPDHELSSIMINLLVNYAATGKPEYRTPDGRLVNIWNVNGDPSQLHVLQLDRDIKMIPFPPAVVKRLQFWDSLNLPNMTLWSPLK